MNNQKNILVLVLLRFVLTWKIVIFDLFTQVPGQTTILAGFAAFFYADSCRRYVNSSFLSPFYDHFCFYGFLYDFWYDFKMVLNWSGSPFWAPGSVRNGFGVQISSSLIPVMSKIIKFEPILKDFDGKYDDQHDHKNGYKPILDEFLSSTTICPWFVCKFPRKPWYREVEGSFLSPFHDHFFIKGRSRSGSR